MMALPPFWQEVCQVVFGGNQKLADAVYWYFEWFQIACLIALVLVIAAFYAVMGFRVFFNGNPEAKKQLKLKMYTPIHAFGLIFLSLISVQFIWNVLVPTLMSLRS